MYFVSLKNINQEKNLLIPQKKLNQISEHLDTLMPNQSISPRYLSRITRLELKKVNQLLSELSFRDLLDVRFIIYCDNEDPDMVHAFDFTSENELLDFIRNNDCCPLCDANLLTSNIRVSFVKKDIPYKKVINND
ncbi:hypothetical protein [Niallia circulans]|uniref:hypothetical protein n=2 Tax=Niallia circulans TaxID=1397 RepID=UPI00077CD5D7|nr:hypothetical protein [Niallia circulans]MDR4317852.1 hypothetical protein [Niallia circulans]MED3841637.1 hypothetical protein [Niallia circulans]MED4243373.1 hypothetical protein [Niallia circulans]MED4248322.1 hypothetical protein [Niallia circulans]QKH62367.1 hypothetical protein FOC77_17805 [Niallia circulans]